MTVRETCREEMPDTYRCGHPAEFILWGKLFKPEALGPRCYEHAAKHIGHSQMSRLDQWAVYDLRPVTVLSDVKAAIDRAWDARYDKEHGLRGGPNSFYAGVTYACAVVRDALRVSQP